MDHYRLITVFTSTYPIDCHILKGRLESEGITCYIYDENMISVDPFNSVAIGGVKLKVEINQAQKAKEIIHSIYNSEQLTEVLQNEIKKQELILKFKKQVLSNPQLINDKDKITKYLNSEHFNQEEVEKIVKESQEFYDKNQNKFIFNWKQFWYELLDFDRNFFKYLHPNTDQFHVEKELIETYKREDKEELDKSICPNCKSDNIKFGYAFDYKPDILYLILSFLLYAPFFPFRKKYHCFNCGCNIKKI